MVIGVDASRSLESIQKTGVEKVSDGLLKAFLSLDKGEECIFYVPQIISWLPASRQVVVKRKRFWTLLGLTRELLLHPPDVFFSPVHELPLFLPPKTYRFLHDVAFKKSPRVYSLKERLYLNWGLARSIKRCQKIFVSTKEVKKNLLYYTQVDPDKIAVVGLGYERKNHISEDKKVKKNQLLYIGRLEEKKNLINLIKAFELFTKNFPDYKLILVGKDGFGAEKIKSFVQKTKAKVVLKGWVEEEEKYKLLRESLLLVHVPTEEGFSYPLLEAFDFGLPVVAADIPVLREVGGNACYFVKPTDFKSIAQGLESLMLNKELQNKLIKNGQQRLKKYTWLEVGQKIFSIIKDIKEA